MRINETMSFSRASLFVMYHKRPWNQSIQLIVSIKKIANFYLGGWDSRWGWHKAEQEEGTEEGFSYFSPYIMSSILFFERSQTSGMVGFQSCMTPRGIVFASGCNSVLPPSHPVQMKRHNCWQESMGWHILYYPLLLYFVLLLFLLTQSQILLTNWYGW